MELRGEQPEMAKVSVSELLQSVKKTLPQTQDNIQVSFEYDKGIYVFADKTLLDDMLRNLLINAIQACKDKGEVTLLCKVEKGIAHFSVSDTGCGMPQDDIKRITDPLFMSDRSRSQKQEGRGLGLALCRKIAELHNTVITFTSEPGAGTTAEFHISLFESEVSQ